jgi:queuosine biosynthesis protein QueC
MRKVAEVKNNDLLILFSGGSDSFLMSEIALKCRYNPLILFINYEQKMALEEYDKAFNYVNKYELNFILQPLRLQIDSALTGNKISGKYENVNENYVPQRNTMFLSIASSIAENFGIDKIWIGCDWSDNLGEFPDCKQEYINKFNELLTLSGSRKIEVECPIMGLTKENVKLILKDFGFDEDEYFSGYGEN